MDKHGAGLDFAGDPLGGSSVTTEALNQAPVIKAIALLLSY